MLQKCTKFYFGTHSRFAVIGGGTAGVSIVAHLKKETGVVSSDIRVFEPNKQHYYQPAWTMVAGNIYKKEDTVRLTREVIPEKVPLSELSVTKIDPKNNSFTTEDGDTHTYDNLIIATGLELDHSAIKGSKEALDDPNCPVGSAYDKNYAQKFQDILKNFESGDFVFHEAPLPIKCPGAPQKVCFLSEDTLRKAGKRERTTVTSYMAKGVIFGVPKYAATLTDLYREKNIMVHLNSKVVEINKDSRVIVYENTQTGVKSQQRFDALHMVPHQVAPKYIKESGLGDATGFVDVDQGTLQHKTYSNIWSLGDSCNAPTSKTAAAIFSQTPVLVHNLMTEINNIPREKAIYDGYTSCPILIGDNKLVLAEFKYNGVVCETFPVDQGTPKGYFYTLKRTIFPWAYWNLVPKGYWYGRRNIMPNLPFYNLFANK